MYEALPNWVMDEAIPECSLPTIRKGGDDNDDDEKGGRGGVDEKDGVDEKNSSDFDDLLMIEGGGKMNTSQ